MGLEDLTHAAIVKSVEEFDDLGRDQFLSRYRFGPARTHFLVIENKHYDAKAIAGVAHQYLSGASAVLRSFKSGEKTVNRKLEELGFIVRPLGAVSAMGFSKVGVRNPVWAREELILVLELYLNHSGNPPGKDSKPVEELSELLNRLGTRLGRRAQQTYRNPNGVYMKVMNFRRFDPDYLERGRSGLTRGGKLEKVVWEEFAGDPQALHRLATAIRLELEQPEPIEQDADDGVEEGAIIVALHRRRERDRDIVRDRKQQALDKYGELRCEGCNLNFAALYGARGEGFIEVHHTKPVSQMDPGQRTLLVDLALVCANCHRMIHRRSPWLNMDELRETIKR